jgi:hypothetical protein
MTGADATYSRRWLILEVVGLAHVIVIGDEVEWRLEARSPGRNEAWHE